MSNSLWYIIAKLRDSDLYPTVGVWTKHTVIHVSSHSIYSQTLMRITESSVLEFDLVRKILLVLVVVVRLPGVPLHRPPFLLVSFPPRPRGFYRSEGSWLFHPVTFRTFAFRTCSFHLRSRKDKRTNFIFFMDLFVPLGKMTCERGIYDTNVGRVIAPVYCTDATHRMLVYLSRVSVTAMPIATAANRARTLIVVYSARMSHVSLPIPQTLVGDLIPFASKDEINKPLLIFDIVINANGFANHLFLWIKILL